LLAAITVAAISISGFGLMRLSNGQLLPV